jgi:hypothetical protein
MSWLLCKNSFKWLHRLNQKRNKRAWQIVADVVIAVEKELEDKLE